MNNTDPPHGRIAPDICVGPFAIRDLHRRVDIDGQTVSGASGAGRGRLFEVTDDDQLRLTIRDTTWDNGERDVVACERHGSPQRFDTLVERLRLQVVEGPEHYVELRQVRLKPNGRGNLFAPDEAGLDAGAGLAVADELMCHGASIVGTRAELVGDDGRHRTRHGVRFPRNAETLPVVAYVLTRVAPVARGATPDD